MGLDLGKISASIGLNTAPLKAGVIQSKAMLSGLAASMGKDAKKAEAGLAGLGTRISNLGAVGGKATGPLAALGSTIGTLGKVEMGVAGIVVLAAGLAMCVKAAMESEKVMAETNALLKTTGGVANVTAGEIEKLSTAIMMKTGYDDEAIQSGANMMLTFRQVRDEAGKNNDIYTQSIPLVADLARKMGLDLPQAALKIGKALNDPVKGLTNLRRFGIMFTDAQEAMIKKLMATGDILGAQKIILEEVKGEMGGVAEAYGKTLPGQIDIAKGAFENLMETVGKSMIPQLTSDVKMLVGAFKLLSALKAPTILTGIAKLSPDVVNILRTVYDLIKGQGGEKTTTMKVDVSKASISDMANLKAKMEGIKAAGGKVNLDTADATKNIKDLDEEVAQFDADLADLTAEATGIGKKLENELAMKGLKGVTPDVVKGLMDQLTDASPKVREMGGDMMQDLIDTIATYDDEMAEHGTTFMDEFRRGLAKAAELGPVTAEKVQGVIDAIVAKYPELAPVANQLGAILTAGVNSFDPSGVLGKLATIAAAAVATAAQLRSVFGVAANATPSEEGEGEGEGAGGSRGITSLAGDIDKLNAVWGKLNKTAIYGWS